MNPWALFGRNFLHDKARQLVGKLGSNNAGRCGERSFKADKTILAGDDAREKHDHKSMKLSRHDAGSVISIRLLPCQSKSRVDTSPSHRL